MTQKLIKNNFLNKFGHKGQISNWPKFVFSTFGSREVFFKRDLTMAAFIQEGKMPVDKDWFTMAVRRGTISLEH